MLEKCKVNVKRDGKKQLAQICSKMLKNDVFQQNNMVS
jgi:hypothetical protein